MRVVFFGSCSLSCMVLGAVQDSVHEVVAVVTQPDMPAGRRLLPCPTPVCAAMQAADAPVFKPRKLVNNKELLSQLAELKPDALLVASYGRIIPKKLLALTDWPLNVHPSPLPLLRGASPVRSALLQGFSETACCIMKMTPQLDDGDVLLREPLAIEPDWNHEQLECRLGELGGQLAVGALNMVDQCVVQLTPQDHSKATYCGTFEKCDMVIDWTRSAAELHNFIRAWDPDTGAATCLNEKQLKVFSASTAPPPEGTVGNCNPGEVAAVTRKAFWVGTGSGLLRIDALQPENKKRMDTASFLAGNRIATGEVFGG